MPLLCAADSNWPQWRGPLFNGSSPSASGLAVEWTDEENVLWKAELPSWSAATPAVWEDVVFVTSAQEGFSALGRYGGRGGGRGRGPGAGGPGRGGPRPRAALEGRAGGASSSAPDELLLIAVNRGDGSLLWKRTVGKGNRIYRKQNLASPSPITDGSHVWVLTGGGDLSCYDMRGEMVWTRNIQDDYGRFGLNHGYASTPRLHNGECTCRFFTG